MKLPLTLKRINRDENGKVLQSKIISADNVYIVTEDDGSLDVSYEARPGLAIDIDTSYWDEFIVENSQGSTIERYVLPDADPTIAEKIDAIYNATAPIIPADVHEFQNRLYELLGSYTTGTLCLDRDLLKVYMSNITDDSLYGSIKSALLYLWSAATVSTDQPMLTTNLSPSTGLEKYGIICNHDRARDILNALTIAPMDWPDQDTLIDVMNLDRKIVLVSDVDFERISDGSDFCCEGGVWWVRASEATRCLPDILERESMDDHAHYEEMNFLTNVI